MSWKSCWRHSRRGGTGRRSRSGRGSFRRSSPARTRPSRPTSSTTGPGRSSITDPVQRGSRMPASILDRVKQGVVVGDGGYLLELERRGYVDSGSDREKVGTGKGSGQFTPEVAIENPDALRGLHREFLAAGAQVLQALRSEEHTSELQSLRHLV